MHISALEEFGLRCALQLARSYGQGPVSASFIAEKEGISVEYVSKFMHQFKKAGVVQSSRGVQGGFTLALPPETVPLKSVFDALGAKGLSGSEEFCGQFAGQQGICVHLQACSVRSFWQILSLYFEKLTQDFTLADLLVPESELSQRVREKGSLINVTTGV